MMPTSAASARFGQALRLTRGPEFQLPLLGHIGAVAFCAGKSQGAVKFMPSQNPADGIFLNALKVQYAAVDVRNVAAVTGDLALKVQIDQAVIRDRNGGNGLKLAAPDSRVKANLPCCQQRPIR